MFSFWPQLVHFWHFLDSFGAGFGVPVKFKNFFGTYLCKQLTLVLEVQTYLFVFDSATCLASFALFWALLGYFWSPDQVINTLLEPTNVGYQFLFWKCTPIFLFLIWPNFVFFWHFLALRGYFWGYGQFRKLFWDLPMQKNNFGFGSTAISFCF